MASHQSRASPPQAARGWDTGTASPASPLCSCPPAACPAPRVTQGPSARTPTSGANPGERGWGCAGAHPPPAAGQRRWGLRSGITSAAVRIGTYRVPTLYAILLSVGSLETEQRHLGEARAGGAAGTGLPALHLHQPAPAPRARWAQSPAVWAGKGVRPPHATESPGQERAVAGTGAIRLPAGGSAEGCPEHTELLPCRPSTPVEQIPLRHWGLAPGCWRSWCGHGSGLTERPR